jgi:RNA polymerase primary sigma factor
MAKKDGKKKKDKKGSGAADTVEAVRSAVERALPEGSKDRGSQIVDEVARAVTKVRESLEQHGVFDELGKLRAEVETLARRVANLERPSAARGTTTASRPAASKSAATRSRSTAAKKPATRKSTTRKPAASRSTSTKRARSTTTKRASTTTKRARSTTTKRPRSSGSGSS